MNNAAITAAIRRKSPAKAFWFSDMVFKAADFTRSRPHMAPPQKPDHCSKVWCRLPRSCGTRTELVRSLEQGHCFSPVLTGRCCMRKWRHESVLDLYNLVLALLLFVSPWFLARASGTAVVDLRASGAAIALLSLVAMFAYASWQEWANLLLGIWLIVSPWLLGFAHTRAMHYSIGVGVAVAFFSALELWLVYDAAHAEPAAHAPEKK